MRIAVAGMSHETNTYAVASTGMTTEERFLALTGEAIRERFTGTGWAVGGILDECARREDDAVPAFFAWAEPSGTIDSAAYASLKERLLEALRAAMPVEAVALELHGAGVVDGIDDLEADLGAAIRRLVGPDVPIAATLDLHGNATPAMAAAYDVLLGCHLYPHTDLYDRGVEAVELLHRVVEEGLRPVVHVEQLPILLPPSTTDGDSPATRANQVCAQLEARPGVIDCTLMHGFPFTDVPDTGSSIIAIADGDRGLASAVGTEAARWVWAHREDFRIENDTPESAVRRAANATSFPVVVNEPSDNPGGGSPGDGTHLLRAMLDAGLSRACFGFISDPEVVQAAIASGVGTRVKVNLGAKHDDLHGRPIPVEGLVRCITDGRFVLRAMLSGLELDLGPSCRLTVDDVDIVVTSKPFQTIDPEVFLLHGIDVSRYKVIGLKSSQHFRAGFRDLAGLIVTADSPGLTTNRVDVFEHVRASRPLWPISPEAEYAG